MADAKQAWLAHRQENGYKTYQPLLTPPAYNLKFAKTANDAVVYGLCLAPHRISGVNVCVNSTPECRRGCVAFAGNGRWDAVTNARITKTRFLAADPSAFVTLLIHELEKAQTKIGDRLIVRLNTFSDLPWEELYPQVFLPGIQYFDYTKVWTRESTASYRLTYSASERTTPAQVVDRCNEGGTVAVIFATTRGKPLPETYHGVPVIDGDKSDARHLDPHGVVVGLRAKGRMRAEARFRPSAA